MATASYDVRPAATGDQAVAQPSSNGPKNSSTTRSAA